MADTQPDGWPEVTLVRWPEQQAMRDDLHRSGRPRLLLLSLDAAVPEPYDGLEDWVRIPVAEAELRARVRWLTHRLGCRPAMLHAPTAPHIDEEGVMRVGGDWVTLPPVEHRLARALLDRTGAVVSREALAAAGWPHGSPGRNALDVHVLRLRRRLAPLSVRIHTVRSRGYLMAIEVTGSGDSGTTSTET